MDSTTARASWARPVPCVRPRIVPRAPGSHHGLPRPVKAGTTLTPPLSGTDPASGPISSDALDDAEVVPEPLDRGARDEGRAFEGVDGSAAELAEVPRDRGDQAVGRSRARRPDVGEHEAPGAVGRLRHAPLEAGLAEQGRLLVSGDARHRRPGQRVEAARRAPPTRSARSKAGPPGGRRAGRRTARSARSTIRVRGCRRAGCGWRWRRRWRTSRPRPRR